MPIDHDYHNNNFETQANPFDNLGKTVQKQTKSKRNPEQVLDLVKFNGGEEEAKCLVKYKNNATPEWVPLIDIRKSHPRLLIDYYESRVILQKNELRLAFDRTKASGQQLIVTSPK